MAIRTAIRAFTLKIGAPGAAVAWRTALLLCAAVAIMSPAAVADYAAGLAAFNRKDYAHAFSEWIESAKAGDAHAQHGIGMLYELGQGVPYADPKAAAGWYEKAAAQNYAPAINNLARLYADGHGVTQDVSKAIDLWSRAAAAGNVTARFNLGLQYAAGAGVPKDMTKAAEFMLQAAESGLPEAQFAIAGYYRDGTGVAKDLEAARLWYDRAAAAGFEPARAELAALEQPVVSAKPAVEDSSAAPAQTQQSGSGGAPTPAEAPAAKPAEQPETPEQQAAPRAPQSAAIPADQPVKQPEQEPAAGAAGEEPAAGEAAAGSEAAPDQEKAAAETPAPEAASDARSDADSDLPVAESLTGDARVYRIWLYSSGQEGDARSYWDKLTMQYPGLLKKLELDLRRYFLGEAKGSLYRVFAGPFESLGAAQKACEDIKQRFGDQFCRPVIN